MIPAKRHELKRMFTKHYELYKKTKGHDQTRRLILFYSIECGLKYLLLKSMNANTTEVFLSDRQLEHLRKKGHDIKFLLKKIGYEGQYVLPTLRTKRGIDVYPNEYNQLWRYGIETDSDVTQKQAEQELERLAIWLGNEISR